MDRLTLELPTDSYATPFAEWQRQVAQLTAEVAQLTAEVATLRRDNLELRYHFGVYKSLHARAVERLEILKRENQELLGHNRRLQARQFGTSTEKQSHSDRSNVLEGFDENEPDPEEPKTPRVAPKRRNYDHLPTKTEVVALPVEQQNCPQCGQPRREMIDTEDSEQLEIEVRAHRRVFHRKRYRKVCDCPGCQTIAAPVPPKLIPKSLLGTSVWVEIFLAKYYSHQPIERLLHSWTLIGLDLSASTVNTGMKRLQPLLVPIYEALRDRNRLSAYPQADETRWLVFIEKEGKVGYRWWMWTFLGEDTVVFVLDSRRSHEVPEAHFTAGILQTLMVDRYSAYKSMRPVKDGVVLLAFCWAHVRRDFIEVAKGYPESKPWAIEELTRIREVYRDHRKRIAKWETPEFAAADAKLRASVTAMETKAAGELSDKTLRDPCRMALASLQNHWVGLTRFVDDPQIPMDNNASERAQRGPAVGRKNYYGSGSEWSGELAMMLFSIFGTLQKQKINPRTWLRWYLDECANAGGRIPLDVGRFLPWNLSDAQKKPLSEAIPFGETGDDLNSS